MTIREQRQLAAVHEAGHAVAAVMRGGSTLTTVTLDDQQHGAGITWSRHRTWDDGFITWAGPWAEARFGWGDRPLDAEDDDGAMFGDHVIGVFLFQPGDMTAYAEACERDDEPLLAAGADVNGLRAVTESEVWPRELERVWPAILQLADRLLAGDAVTDAVARAAVEACWSA